MTIDGEQRMAGGEPIDVVQPHRHAHVLGTTANATDADVARPRSTPRWRPRRPGATCRSTSGPPSCCAPPTCSPARGGTRSTRRPCSASRRPCYQAEIDAACELIDFLRFNVPLRPADPRRAAAVVARRVEPVRPPPAGGLRLRDHPVQLHRDRRQPAARARADGQHRGLEAVADPAVRGALHDAAARGGRPAARRDQPGHRRRPARSPRSRSPTRTWPASTSPARPRTFQHLWRTVGDNIAALPLATRGWSARPAARTSSSRTQRRRRPRCSPRWSGARSSTRGRSARRPPARTCRARCGTAACATSWSPTTESLDVRRRHRLLATSAAR